VNDNLRLYIVQNLRYIKQKRPLVILITPNPQSNNIVCKQQWKYNLFSNYYIEKTTMKLVRFKLKNTIKYGVLTDNSVIEIRGNIYTMFRKTSYEYDLDDIEILCPVKARQIWGPTKNGTSSDGVVETDGKVILDPWLKGSNAICGPNAPVIVENDLFSGVHITGSVVAVIGKECKKINSNNISKYILGYTCGIDISKKEWFDNDETQWRAKSSDNFSPVGPWINTEFNTEDFNVTISVNDIPVQQFSNQDLICKPQEVVSYICQQITLKPGDMVFIGGQNSVIPVWCGDNISCEIPGLGRLGNQLVKEYVPGVNSNLDCTESQILSQSKLVG
jgi:2-keto-4-pentenoate hydratase/2-oxohepta-3-ene-1,7-dioic acid hydratase in catechol pathway